MSLGLCRWDSDAGTSSLGLGRWAWVNGPGSSACALFNIGGCTFADDNNDDDGFADGGDGGADSGGTDGGDTSANTAACATPPGLFLVEGLGGTGCCTGLGDKGWLGRALG